MTSTAPAIGPRPRCRPVLPRSAPRPSPSLTFSATTLVDGWTFQAGAPNYTFSSAISLGFQGAGITGNVVPVTFNNNGNTATLVFLNSATAGNATINNNLATTSFFNSATAGTAGHQQYRICQFFRLVECGRFHDHQQWQ